MEHQSTHTLVQNLGRSFTVRGRFPSGGAFSRALPASDAIEAQLRAIADCRYSDDGGDLTVLEVIDEHSERQMLPPIEQDLNLLVSELVAIEEVLDHVSAQLPPPSFGAMNTTHSTTDFDRFRAYVEYFRLALARSPLAFEGLTAGVGRTFVCEIEFEDSFGYTVRFEPSVAMLSLVGFVLRTGLKNSAVQVTSLVTVARAAFNQAAFDALSEE